MITRVALLQPGYSAYINQNFDKDVVSGNIAFAARGEVMLRSIQSELLVLEVIKVRYAMRKVAEANKLRNRYGLVVKDAVGEALQKAQASMDAAQRTLNTFLPRMKSMQSNDMIKRMVGDLATARGFSACLLDWQVRAPPPSKKEQGNML